MNCIFDLMEGLCVVLTRRTHIKREHLNHCTYCTYLINSIKKTQKLTSITQSYINITKFSSISPSLLCRETIRWYLILFIRLNYLMWSNIKTINLTFSCQWCLFTICFTLYIITWKIAIRMTQVIVCWT